MADALIVLILIVVLIFALKGTIKHFRGEGACCGGGSGKVRKPKDKILEGPVTAQKTIRISGMHCENCVNSVTRAINKVDGASARVNLQEGTAVVSCDRQVDDETLRRAVEKAGFQVVSIS
ncbi:MAG: heavy-metal-associated domain-containing protein [Clostridiales bacterium]|nr:heavy-metal-associated domain-containing protein [Clostridiales bacterium]